MVKHFHMYKMVIYFVTIYNTNQAFSVYDNLPSTVFVKTAFLPQNTQNTQYAVPMPKPSPKTFFESSHSALIQFSLFLYHFYVSRLTALYLWIPALAKVI